MSKVYKFNEEGRVIAEGIDSTLESEPSIAEIRELARRATSSGPVYEPIRQWSRLRSEEFCYHIASGKTVDEACVASGITYAEYIKYRGMYQEFSEMVEAAKKLRAETVFEELLKVARYTEASRDEVSLGKLRSEIYKHVASVSDEKYIQKQRVQADHRVGVVNIETGIRRPGDEGFEIKDANLDELVDSTVSFGSEKLPKHEG